MTAGFRQSPEFAKGSEAERRVADWLRQRGWYVIPSYDYSGAGGDKPPRLEGLAARYAVPDLDVARDGRRRWVEVKYKSTSPLFHNMGCRTHGIDSRLLAQYRAVERITGTDCWLAIYQADTRELLMAGLAGLGEPQCHRGMAYWPRDRFEVVHIFPAEVAA